MSYLEIEKFNNILVEKQHTINIIDYIKDINNLYYKIEIDFIDEFIELINKDDFCIHHEMLKKYGILTLSSSTNDIKRLLEQYDLEENIDFQLQKQTQLSHNGGCTHKINYYLHPRAFEICLMRAKNTKKYTKYYLLLSQCIRHYNNYQNKLKENFIIELKIKINNQNNNINNLQNLITEKDNNINNLQNIITEKNNKLSSIKDKINFYDNFWKNNKLNNNIDTLK
jgi:hypothetical protein